MRTATIQGRLWGKRARDYADYAESAFRPLFTRVLTETGVGEGTLLLDVGCGTGMATSLASRLGAMVFGLDAAETSIDIARERVPSGDFRLGELEELPWPDATFDVVTGFNSFQFAADKVNALRQARRVAKPGGLVAMATWGRAQDCGMSTVAAAISQFFPPAPPEADGPFSLGVPGRLEELLERAGLTPATSGEVDCPFVFPDLDTALRAVLSAGIFVAAAERVVDEPVRGAVAAAREEFETAAGGYYQPNRQRFVVART